MTLPKSHKPGYEPTGESTITIPHVRFAIGVPRGTTELGMTDGPFIKLKHALETIPEYPKSQLVMLSSDARINVLLYKWREAKGEWHLIDKERHWWAHPDSDCIYIDTVPTKDTVGSFSSECVDLGIVKSYDQEELNDIYRAVYEAHTLKELPNETNGFHLPF